MFDSPVDPQARDRGSIHDSRFSRQEEQTMDQGKILDFPAASQVIPCYTGSADRVRCDVCWFQIQPCTSS